MKFWKEESFGTIIHWAQYEESDEAYINEMKETSERFLTPWIIGAESIAIPIGELKTWQPFLKSTDSSGSGY